jgi:hypothetical protein
VSGPSVSTRSWRMAPSRPVVVLGAIVLCASLRAGGNSPTARGDGERRKGAVFSAGANWVCTGALTQSRAATARSIAPDAAARVDAASASLQEHESSQLPSQLLSQDSSQLVLQSALSVSGSPSHS